MAVVDCASLDRRCRAPSFPMVDDLDDLNIYTRRYHHGENPQAAVEPISDGELHCFVKKTMTITGCV